MYPINESLREIDSDHWLIANKMLLSRRRSRTTITKKIDIKIISNMSGTDTTPKPTGTNLVVDVDDGNESVTNPRLPDQVSWSDGKGGLFMLSDAPYPLPQSKPLSQTSEIRKVYDAGTVSTVWQVGEAFIKAKQVIVPNATREHVTLDYLHAKSSLDFNIPTVYYHTELDGRYFIVLSSLTGQTLADAWLGMDETTKECYVRRIATICNHLMTWKGDKISGVDGNHLSDLFLSKDESCEPQSLLNGCLELGMDCSSLVFYHCDLGPGNIIISPEEGSIGIIDWETAGYVPKEWIRTKFRLSSGMDLPVGNDAARQDWRRRVSQHLGDLGFLEVAKKVVGMVEL